MCPRAQSRALLSSTCLSLRALTHSAALCLPTPVLIKREQTLLRNSEKVFSMPASWQSGRMCSCLWVRAAWFTERRAPLRGRMLLCRFSMCLRRDESYSPERFRRRQLRAPGGSPLRQVALRGKSSAELCGCPQTPASEPWAALPFHLHKHTDILHSIYF